MTSLTDFILLWARFLTVEISMLHVKHSNFSERKKIKSTVCPLRTITVDSWWVSFRTFLCWTITHDLSVLETQCVTHWLPLFFLMTVLSFNIVTDGLSNSQGYIVFHFISGYLHQFHSYSNVAHILPCRRWVYVCIWGGPAFEFAWPHTSEEVFTSQVLSKALWWFYNHNFEFS